MVGSVSAFGFIIDLGIFVPTVMETGIEDHENDLSSGLPLYVSNNVLLH